MFDFMGQWVYQILKQMLRGIYFLGCVCTQLDGADGRQFLCHRISNAIVEDPRPMTPQGQMHLTTITDLDSIIWVSRHLGSGGLL